MTSPYDQRHKKTKQKNKIEDYEEEVHPRFARSPKELPRGFLDKNGSYRKSNRSRSPRNYSDDDISPTIPNGFSSKDLLNRKETKDFKLNKRYNDEYRQTELDDGIIPSVPSSFSTDKLPHDYRRTYKDEETQNEHSRPRTKKYEGKYEEKRSELDDGIIPSVPRSIGKLPDIYERNSRTTKKFEGTYNERKLSELDNGISPSVPRSFSTENLPFRKNTKKFDGRYDEKQSELDDGLVPSVPRSSKYANLPKINESEKKIDPKKGNIFVKFFSKIKNSKSFLACCIINVFLTISTIVLLILTIVYGVRSSSWEQSSMTTNLILYNSSRPFQNYLCSMPICQNGGICNEYYSNFVYCMCPMNYSGAYCQFFTNTTIGSNSSCHSYPCLNGGSCFQNSTDFLCICGHEFTGFLCQNNTTNTTNI